MIARQMLPGAMMFQEIYKDCDAYYNTNKIIGVVRDYLAKHVIAYQKAEEEYHFIWKQYCNSTHYCRLSTAINYFLQYESYLNTMNLFYIEKGKQLVFQWLSGNWELTSDTRKDYIRFSRHQKTLEILENMKKQEKYLSKEYGWIEEIITVKNIMELASRGYYMVAGYEAESLWSSQFHLQPDISFTKKVHTYYAYYDDSL